MSMHMIKGVQVHGKSSKKKKPPTAGQLKQLEVEWRQYNKRMRQTNSHSMQFQAFDDYVAYTRGEYKPKSKKKEFNTYAPTEPFVSNTKSYPSLKTSDTIPGGPTPRKESQQYTGNLIVGIGTMHKSNMVPIMRGTNEAKDIASMRR